MTKGKEGDPPRLYFNGSEEDRKALCIVLASRMPCELRPASDEPTPELVDGFCHYKGLEEIEKFVEDWEESQQNRA